MGIEVSPDFFPVLPTDDDVVSFAGIATDIEVGDQSAGIAEGMLRFFHIYQRSGPNLASPSICQERQ